nr:immunoglobulin light chain junction region [Macaca mulatta]
DFYCQSADSTGNQYMF